MPEVTKKVKENLALIWQLSSNTLRGKWQSPDSGVTTACILQKVQPAGFRLTILHPGPSSLMNKLKLEIAQVALGQYVIITGKHFSRVSNRVKQGKRPYAIWEYDVEEISTCRPHPEIAYFRCIIPLPERFEHEHYFESNIYNNDTIGDSRGLLAFKVGANAFHVYSVAHNGQLYLVMDCQQAMTAAEFNEHCWSASIGLAFVTGRLWQNEQYIFSFSSNDMESALAWSYDLLRPGIYSIYAGISGRPISWLMGRDNQNMDRYDGKAIGISSAVLGNLCSWIHQKDAYKALTLLVIEAKQATLLMSPAGFALALEGLATAFEEWCPEKIAPIKDKTKAKALKKELMAIIHTRENDKDFNLQVLIAKINDLNKPTNRSRLKAPFELLGIPLSPADEKALDYRNTILHGNVLLAPMDKKSFEMEETELAMRLLTLVNAIVFKLVGYQGWILNHAKIQERSFKKTIDEEYFRDLGPQELRKDLIL